MIGYKLVMAEESHIPGILEIYNEIVLHTHISFEYHPPSEEEMHDRITEKMIEYPWLVAVDHHSNVMAFGYASRLRARKAYDWSAELSVYVHPEFRNRRLATVIYQALIELLSLQKVNQVFGAISLPNKISEQFHQNFGFEKVGVLNKVGFKFGKWHHIAWYQKEIRMDVAPQEFNPFSKIENDVLIQTLKKYIAE